MNDNKQSHHPCDRSEAFKPWMPDHLYIGDSGEVLCGCCMGIESTFTPWAWSDLGPVGPDRSLRYGDDPTVLRCESDRYAYRRAG